MENNINMTKKQKETTKQERKRILKIKKTMQTLDRQPAIPLIIDFLEGIIDFMPLVGSHSAGLPLVSENTCSCPNHFAPLMLLPFDRLTITLKTS